MFADLLIGKLEARDSLGPILNLFGPPDEIRDANEYKSIFYFYKIYVNDAWYEMYIWIGVKGASIFDYASNEKKYLESSFKK